MTKRKFVQQDDLLDFSHVGTKFDPKEDRCRHEFGPDTHLPTLLARFPRLDPLNPQKFGVQDFTGDLTSKFELTRNAEAIYAAMPQALRDKYPTWRMFWRALEAGEVELLDKLPEPPEVSSGGAGSSASEARQGGQ